MPNVDDVFAQIAVQKNFATVAEIEAAKNHLGRLAKHLESPPPLSAVLRRLGVLDGAQVRLIDRQIESLTHTCRHCGEHYVTLDQTQTDRCDGCAKEHKEPEPLSLIPGMRSQQPARPPARENPYAHRRDSRNSAAGRARSRAATFWDHLDPAPTKSDDSPTQPAPSRARHTQDSAVQEPRATNDTSRNDSVSSKNEITTCTRRRERASKFFSDLTSQEIPAPDLSRAADKEAWEQTRTRHLTPEQATQASLTAQEHSEGQPSNTHPTPQEDRGTTRRIGFVDETLPPPPKPRVEDPFAAAPQSDLAPLADPRTDPEQRTLRDTNRLEEKSELQSDAFFRLQASPTETGEAKDRAPSVPLSATQPDPSGEETVNLDPSAFAPTGPTVEVPSRSRKQTSNRTRVRAKTESALVGKTLGGCEVIRLLGRGGMGSVYLARQIDLERDVALKVLAPKLTKDKRQVAQFFREAKALARVEHRNIVTIYQVGSEEDVHFLVMQLVTGGSLGDLLKKRRRLDVEQACEFITQIARGLAAAHAAGIVHRDVKPDNVLLATDASGPVLKVTDFGLARMEGEGGGFTTGKIVGTPFYMSPEQIDGNRVDQRTDIYALGATFYHLLTGQPPFEGETAIDIMLAHVNDPLLPPCELRREIPEAISNVVCKMLAKEAEQRYPDLPAMLTDLDKARAGARVQVDLDKLSGKRSPESQDLDATLRPMAELLEPVAVERPRSLRFAAVGLVALFLLAVLLGAGPLRALLADDEAPSLVRQLPRHEREAKRALEELLSGIEALSLPARVRALERLIESHPDTQAAKEAETKLDLVQREISDRAHALTEQAVAAAKQHADENKLGSAIETLRAAPQWVRSFAEHADRLDAMEKTLRERLAEQGLAYVPTGEFQAGDRGVKTGPNRERTAWTDGFYIDRTEVTCAEYAEFVREGGGRPPASWGGDQPPAGAESLPVTGITLEQAKAYAAFRGKRLPTALEWEKAYRGVDGRRYPWGDEEDAQACNSAAAGLGTLAAPGNFPRDLSPWGCLDMAGNAAEMTIGPGDGDGRRAPATERLWVRGGSYATQTLATCRAAFFYDGPDADGHRLVGFRCVRDLER